MPPSASPRRHTLDAWRAPAHALLKAKDKVSKISGVLISLLVLHGPARFDELFTGTNAVAFANRLDPQRDKMFSASERIPTGTALSCLRAATDLSRVFSKPKNSANKRHLLIKSLQDSMLWDDITKFRVLDDTAIQKLVDLICTMDNWTFPRNLLLGENKESGNGKTYSRELDLMAEIYECEPTTEEENLQVVENMVENAQAAGTFVSDWAAKIMRAWRQTPDQPAEPEKEWADILMPCFMTLLFWWIWAYGMSFVCVTWFDAVLVNLPEDDVERKKAYYATLVLEWDCWALILFFVVSRWHRWWNTSMLLMFVGLLSVQLANSLPQVRIIYQDAFPQVVLCWNNYMQFNSTVSTTLCENEDNICENEVTMFKIFVVSYVYFYFVFFMLVANLVDMAMSVAAIVHNNKDLDMDDKDKMLHFPYCFITCVLYVLTDHLQGTVPSFVVHTLNTVVFFLFGAWTFADSHKTRFVSSAISLHVSRFICLFVCVTDWCVCNLTGFPTNHTWCLGHYVILLGMLHTNLFWFFLADCIFSKLCVKKRCK